MHSSCGFFGKGRTAVDPTDYETHCRAHPNSTLGWFALFPAWSKETLLCKDFWDTLDATSSSSAPGFSTTTPSASASFTPASNDVSVALDVDLNASVDVDLEELNDFDAS